MYRPAILGLVELPDALDFARTNRWSVLTTIRGNDHPQVSNVAHYVGDAERRAVVRLTPDRAYGMLSLPGRRGARQE